jgi:PAS domain S-box-containing protein
VVLIGWAVDSPALEGATFGGLTASTGAAAGLVLGGCSLCLLVPALAPAWRRRTGVMLAAVVMLGGALTIVSLAERHLRQAVVAGPPGSTDSGRPDPMGPPAAVGLVLCGTGLLLAGTRRRRLVTTREYLAFAAALVAVVPILAIVYGVRPFSVLGYTDTAFPAAVGLLLLALGILFSRPHAGLMRLVCGDDPGGVLLRRTLPAAAALAVLLGWLTLRAERTDVFDGALATGMLVAGFIVLCSILLVASAIVVRREAEAMGQAKDQLRRSEQVLAEAGEMAHLGAWWIDLENPEDLNANRLQWSDEVYRIFGYEPGGIEATNALFFEHVHPDDRGRITAAVARAMAERAPYSLEHRIVRPDGTERIVHEHAQIVCDERGQPRRIVGAVQDITERKRMELELTAARLAAEGAKAQAEEASRAKDRFLAVLSHELRTPLTPVLAGVALVQQDARLPPAMRQRLELIRRNVELEARLIDDLLDLTRIARGKVDLDRRRIELGTIIERAVEVCRPDIEARGLHFEVDHGPGGHVIEADAGRLQQVFWNILKNAVKFTPHGGRVALRCRRDDDQVVVEVSDSGIGIAPEAFVHIFDAFAQADRTIARQFGGLGLGLAISRALVEMHGGSIAAHSSGPGQGATFTIRLPLVAGAAPGMPTDAPCRGVGERQRRPLRVLLVEDHGDAVTTLVDIFELHGHQVETAGDVATALAIAARGDFDVLVSDLGLPDGSGLDLVHALRSRGDRLPALALSGYGQETDLQRSRAAGFHAHLVKPVDPAHLLETMETVASGTVGTAGGRP